MSIIGILISAVGALLGALFISKSKNNTITGLLQNADVAKKETTLDSNIAINNAAISVDNTDIQKAAEEKKNEEANNQSSADFLNQRK